MRLHLIACFFVFHRLPLLMQPMRVCPYGGRVLIRLPLLPVDAQHLVAGYILQRSNAAAGLPLRAVRRALASYVPVLQPVANLGF
jgi:hypothetical protein